jgi:hypothetical protein
VNGRIKELVRLEGVRALCKLINGAGPATQEQVATAFAQVRSQDECPQACGHELACEGSRARASDLFVSLGR